MRHELGRAADHPPAHGVAVPTIDHHRLVTADGDGLGQCDRAVLDRVLPEHDRTGQVLDPAIAVGDDEVLALAGNVPLDALGGLAPEPQAARAVDEADLALLVPQGETIACGNDADAEEHGQPPGARSAAAWVMMTPA